MGRASLRFCSNKLLDLERRFQTHPQPFLNAARTPSLPFFSSSLEKCISVKDIQAGSSLHVFCLQPCSSSFTLSCSQLLPHSPARDLKETLGGSWSRGGTHTYADVYMWQAPAKQWLSAEGQRRSGRRRRRGSGKFLGWPDWSINSSPGSAEVRERERERGGESKGKCADLPGESKKVWDCDGVGGGVLLSLCHSGCVQRLWGFSLSLCQDILYCRAPEKERWVRRHTHTHTHKHTHTHSHTQMWT